MRKRPRQLHSLAWQEVEDELEFGRCTIGERDRDWATLNLPVRPRLCLRKHRSDVGQFRRILDSLQS